VKKVLRKGLYFGILCCYDSFVYGVSRLEQRTDLYDNDIWQRDWTFYEIIADYYKGYPDPKIKIISGENAVEEEESNDDGGGTACEVDSTMGSTLHKLHVTKNHFSVSSDVIGVRKYVNGACIILMISSIDKMHTMVR
jgi:hypothetical protein